MQTFANQTSTDSNQFTKSHDKQTLETHKTQKALKFHTKIQTLVKLKQVPLKKEIQILLKM